MRSWFDKAIWMSANIEKKTVARWRAGYNEQVVSSKPQVPAISIEMLDKQ